jgi:hypothetical protein
MFIVPATITHWTPAIALAPQRVRIVSWWKDKDLDHTLDLRNLQLRHALATRRRLEPGTRGSLSGLEAPVGSDEAIFL